MVEPLNDWNFDNLAQFGQPYSTTVGRILVQRPVRSPRMIVIQIRGQKTLEMPFVEDDDMIQKLPTKAADHAFDIGVGQGEAGVVTTSSLESDGIGL